MKPLKFISAARHLRQWFFLLLLLAILPFQILADGTASAEYKLKAALFYKLTQFVEWPMAIQDKSPKGFNICILGRDDFGDALDVLKKRKVNGAPVLIHYFKQSESIANNCQLLFISDSKRAFLGSIFENIAQYPILTIGDSPQFAEKGGMIQFTQGKKRIGFKINLKRAKASGLGIAAPLLQLSTIVDP